MALVTNFTCSHCNEPRYELVTRDRVCSDCRAKDKEAADKAHRVALASYKGLTTEERLDRMEALLYDLLKVVDSIDKRTTPERTY